MIDDSIKVKSVEEPLPALLAIELDGTVIGRAGMSEHDRLHFVAYLEEVLANSRFAGIPVVVLKPGMRIVPVGGGKVADVLLTDAPEKKPAEGEAASRGREFI